MKLLPLFILLGSLLFPANADHLLLIRVVTQPDAAESFSIYNPTDSPINLSNYYISEEEDYSKIQSVGNMSPSHFLYGFTARFPDLNIEPNDTLIIGLNYRYKEFYGEDNPADLVMYIDQVNSMIETEDKSFGIPFSDKDGDDNDFGNISADSCNTVEGIWHGNEGDDTAFCGDGIGCNGTEITYCNDENNSNCIEECDDINPIGKFDDGTEMLILFYWDGNSNNLIQDVDYFLWGDSLNSIDKSEVPGYQNDTSVDDQLYFETVAGQYYAYSRIGTEEIDEIGTNGNGITDHDETSENFRESWEIIELFNLGCTDSDAPNFDASADIDDGSCFIPFIDVLNDLYDCNASSNGYCDSSPACPVVKLQGMIVDYFDVTVYGGPHAVTVEDEEGFRVEATIWPSEWDIAADETSNYLITPPFNKYLMEFQGSVFEYEGDKQILICSPEDFTVVKSFDQEGFFTEDDSASVQISPAPFVLLPSLGETLDFSYSFPNNSRVLVRIFDISGRFITSLVDKYYSNSGIVKRDEGSSAWDGRDQLGQIVSPGTYIMHMEVMNPVTGETQTDAAPIVVGVKN